MSGQSTLGEDELFGEAADEMRDDVEEHLAAAWAALPDGDDVWETDSDNVLGVLNGLRSALDADDAEDHLRQAKKWYAVGERADAFEDAEDLRDEVEALEDVIEQISEASEEVGSLASTVPQLRSALEEAGEGTGDEEPETDESGDDGDADEEGEDDADEESEGDEDE